MADDAVVEPEVALGTVRRWTHDRRRTLLRLFVRAPHHAGPAFAQRCWQARAPRRAATSPLDLAGMLLLVLALRLGSTLVLILAVEEVLARRRLRRIGVLVEREEPPLRVGRRLLDLPPSL